MQKLVILVLTCLLSTEHLSQAYIARVTRNAESDESSETDKANGNFLGDSIISSVTREAFEREALKETINFLNALFQSQIDYYSKVKEFLPPTAKRVQDINKYTQRLQRAIALQTVQEKEKMWRDIFVEFKDSVFLLNDEKETGVSAVRYLEILNDGGLQEITKKFLINVTTYFWKMAKVSGKAVGSTIGDTIEKWKDD
ncbi:uncharacterized protein [Eurosta solidaginis]|uniref:uncharacterized protein n=1 Tax=Eurosta solidaginis TaxID=178769 RepID=UPI0035312B20